MKLSQLATILNIGHIEYDREIEVLLTDSRQLTFPSSTLFFALSTPTGDGHLYIDELYHAGVRAFVVERQFGEREQYPKAQFLTVPNVLDALQKIGAERRRTFKGKVVAITGSNGKTTIKEYLYQLLIAARVNADRSPRSYNSQIGVPLSLWQADANADVCLIEVGISKPGEMDKLAEIVAPDIVLITNIGEAHQENFSSLSLKAEEKCKLATLSHPYLLLYSSRDAVLSEAVSKITAPLVCRSYTDHKSRLTPPSSISDLLLPENLSAVMALLDELVPSLSADAPIWNQLEAVEMRLEIFNGIHDTIIIDDAYNNDASALLLALEQLKRISEKSNSPSCLILSDMAGMSAPHLREALLSQVADMLRKMTPDKLIFVGKQLAELVPELETTTQAPVCFATTNHFLETFDPQSLKGYTILLKGARTFRFEKISALFHPKRHQSILDINLTALLDNLKYYRSLVPSDTRFVAMVKAFGYGSGDVEIARLLESHHCHYLAVALIDEGVKLREEGIRMPIMVMNPEASALAHMCKHSLEPEVYSLTLLDKLIESCKRLGITHYPIHIKLDTGMHRLGFDTHEQFTMLLEKLKSTNRVRVKSIFTHLAAADDITADEKTLNQLHIFQNWAKELEETLGYSVLKHALNSAGISRFPQYSMDMVRLGIGLYGYPPYDEDGKLKTSLRAVASLKSIILQIKDIPAGDSVGYGTHATSDTSRKIGIVPIGYADGIDRRLGNGNMSVLLQDGTLAPTVGNICMDAMIIDLTQACSVAEGEEVVIFDEQLPLQRLSSTLGTIPYEIITSISSRIARHYFRE
ncbi:MAG: alanine racemase [Porphyromonas sp.]|nr:alanine racemase [Porphyromonas sp.]